jgi:hypothetical protein
MASEYRFNSNNLLKGEEARKGITVTRNSGTLDITSAYVTTYDAKDDSVVTARAAADFSGANVSALIAAGSSKGSRYTVFEFFDDPYTRKVRLDYDIV